MLSIISISDTIHETNKLLNIIKSNPSLLYKFYDQSDYLHLSSVVNLEDGQTKAIRQTTSKQKKKILASNLLNDLKSTNIPLYNTVGYNKSFGYNKV